MEIGVCCGVDSVDIVKRVGYSYFEWSVGNYLKPSESEDAFLATKKQVDAVDLPCPALNVFLPGSLKITGPNVAFEALSSYVETAMRRAQIANINTIVFGSGGARRVPDGFSHETAMDQLVKFGEMTAQTAQKYGVRVAVEHLNRQECNILTSVQESAEYVRRVNHPSFKLLVDAYHWAKEEEPLESISENGDLIIHAHIATPANRRPPGVEEYDFGPFLSAMRNIGYEGRLSIEARLEDVEQELEVALKYLKQI